MKLSLSPVAAVAVALASTAAQAQLSAPTQAISSSPTPTTLYVAVWDSNTNASELVNLSYTFSQLTAAGALGPNSSADPNGANYTTATNPGTGTGNVLQLNFGVLNGWSSNFPSPSGTTDYMILASNNSSAQSDLFTYINNTDPASLTNSALNTMQGNILAAVGSWASATGLANPGVGLDKNCSTNYCAIGNNLQSGSLGLAAFTGFGGTVGSALDFFRLVKGSGFNNPSMTQYGNTTGTGFWFLSSSGDLTWNVPLGGGTSVPLPAAAWLLVSGLLGLGAIGRRRLTAA